MKIEYYIGKRFAFSNKRFSFITTLSIISSIGIAIGVASLIIMISVFNGFGKVITDIMVGFDPHLRIENISDANSNIEMNLISDIKNNIYISGISKTLNGKVLSVTNNGYSVSYLRGYEEGSFTKVTGLEKSIIEGRSTLNKNEILISVGLASKLDLQVGDKIKLFSTNQLNDYFILGSEGNSNEGVVAGIFRSGNKQYDANYIYTNLDLAKNILGSMNSVGYDIRFNNLEITENVKADLQNKYGNNVTINSWYDLHRDLYSIMKIERWSAFIILTLIIIVAVCNLLGSLSLTVISKRNDIGLLRAIGMKKKIIEKIFRLQGLLVGSIGTTVGVIFGLLICYLQETLQLYKLDSSVYIISAIPVNVKIEDVILISIISIILSFIASVIPSKSASKIVPIEALRYE
ncbi:MAG: ABC transporter permease [Ignavibacteria bacterium]|nr:ABC transporter permease [Ignavibacteria bacterium]